MVNQNIAGNNIGGEGLQFWILKISPVHTKKLLRTKIILSSDSIMWEHNNGNILFRL